MLKYLFLVVMSLFGYATHTLANDGVFYTRGNQLIPYFEKTISLKKEILTLRKIKNEYIEVTVDYTFHNPGSAKKVKVGFEAAGPSGDADITPLNGAHRYIHDFTVEVNKKNLPYEIAYVEDSTYANNGVINGLTKIPKDEDSYEDAFFYVYHFDVDFQSGDNKIIHTYRYDLSGSVDLFYDFEYVLTAANRWANQQIDDFTLIIDMGDPFQDFQIQKTFFNSFDDWNIPQRAKAFDNDDELYGYSNTNGATRFCVEEGEIVFKKQNFKPKNELYVYAKRFLILDEEIDENIRLPYQIEQQENLLHLFFDGHEDNENLKKILLNLPYARRGYVFQNKVLKNHYENFVDWYMPNPELTQEMINLHEEEKLFLQYINGSKLYNTLN